MDTVQNIKLPPWCPQDRAYGAPMRRTAAVVLALSLCAACGGGGSTTAKPPPPSTLTVAGSIRVEANPDFLTRKKADIFIGAPCTASDAFSDVARGTQVVVEDQGGTTLGLGSLDSGTLFGHVGQVLLTLQCQFTFAVSNVPTSKPFYKVQVGRRGAQQFTAAQIAKPIRLTLS